MRQIFFNMMRGLGDEMQESTGVLALNKDASFVLDLCAAPGGFIATALKYNPTATVCGTTLPEALGGHPVLVKYGTADPRVNLDFRDITMLGKEFGLSDTEGTNATLSCDRPFLGESFDLVFCDGAVLRTHAPYRDEKRETFEAGRLTCSQLILALQRIREGGTLIMLLHKVETWNTLRTLHAFPGFANIQLFKPKKCHTSRSSFYLIATGVRPEAPAAKIAVEKWKAMWKEATVGAPKDPAQEDPSNSLARNGEQDVNRLLQEFGGNVVQLAEPVWLVQRDALSKKTWTR